MLGKSFTSTTSSKGQTTLPATVRIRRATPLDLNWAKAVESTLTEWSSPADDDL
jgi:hypothetical protein